jgi:hypothetical protein
MPNRLGRERGQALAAGCVTDAGSVPAGARLSYQLRWRRCGTYCASAGPGASAVANGPPPRSESGTPVTFQAATATRGLTGD